MAHNKAQILVHLVCATSGREPFIQPDVEPLLYRLIEGICTDLGCSVHGVGGTVDHIHLLVGLPVTLAVATLVARAKGATSRLVSERIGPARVLRWQSGYGVFAVSPADRKRVAAYIAGQKEHHATTHLWPTAERTTMDS